MVLMNLGKQNEFINILVTIATEQRKANKLKEEDLSIKEELLEELKKINKK